MNLIQKIAVLTQLPPELVTKELYRVADKKGLDIPTMDMEDLRMLLADYVQEVLEGLTDEAEIKASLM